MKYVALLRGINVGGNKKIAMKSLKTVFESLGYRNVSTYINSGNVLFESSERPVKIQEAIEKKLKMGFGFDVRVLIKSVKEMKTIADAIPRQWENDSEQRTDVAYLFPELDSAKTINELPVKKEFIDIRYVKGAIFWNIRRKDVNKSHLVKLISHKLYQFMTVRNINTARYLGNV
jgi:uncharacterized protein (DUF1697 family)